MKKSKILILVVTLSFPVILYLFLRSYGQNEYELPIFFENSEMVLCQDTAVDGSMIPVLSRNSKDTFALDDIYSTDYTIIHFPNVNDTEIKSLQNELNRIMHTFNDLSISILSLEPLAAGGSTGGESSFLSKDNTETYLYNPEHKASLVNCIYGFPSAEWAGNHPSEETFLVDHTLVLLDKNRNIRGYYDGYETKDVDRLILEIRVLLSDK